MNYIWGDLHGVGPAHTRQRGAVRVIVRGEAKPGEDGELEGLLHEFAEDVRYGERGCLSYTVTRMLGSPAHFAVHARFAGWLSFCKHGLTAHLRRAMPGLTARLASPVSLEVFFEV